jgi:hypothetical protein
MKVAELTGATLDYWVAKAEAMDAEIYQPNAEESVCIAENRMNFCPSMDWRQGGPIIERAHIVLDALYDEREWIGWEAKCYSLDGTKDHMAGEWAVQMAPTLLTAAMRAYVASKYGEEVPDDSQA